MIKNLLTNHFLSGLKILVVLVSIISLLTPIGANALSPEQIRLYQSGVYYFDDHATAAQSATCTPAGSGVGSGGDGKPVYMVGDSIGRQVQTTLPGALAGRQVKVNAVDSRTISVEPPPSGMGALVADQEYIKGASVVLVQLGTNSGGFTAEAVGQMVSKIRELAPNATIYWVDTAGVKQPIASTLSNVNSIIHSQAQTHNYQVISWNKKVFGDSADPKNINPNAADNGYIRRADQYVHLTESGVQAMTDLIANAVKNGPAVGANGCACTLLAGSDNIEKIWNFFAKKNLTPPAIAGIMGNMQAESGFEPRRVQYGTTNSRGEVSRQGQPSSLDDTPAAGGYGIVQWTPGTKIMAAAQKLNKPPGDLGFQLDLLWAQLTDASPATDTGISEKGAGIAVFASTTVEEATSAFMLKYERPLDQSIGAQNKRLNLFSIPLLTKYGSGSPGSSSTGTSSC